MAKNRGGQSADDEFDDAVDAELDDLESDRDIDRDADRRPARTKASSATAKARTAARSKTKDEKRPGPIGKIPLFVREVVSELQKVIWPTRKELLTYTAVVVIFVAIMMTYVALADYGLARLMFLVFGRHDDTPATS